MQVDPYLIGLCVKHPQLCTNGKASQAAARGSWASLRGRLVGRLWRGIFCSSDLVFWSSGLLAPEAPLASQPSHRLFDQTQRPGLTLTPRDLEPHPTCLHRHGARQRRSCQLCRPICRKHPPRPTAMRLPHRMNVRRSPLVQELSSMSRSPPRRRTSSSF